MDEVKREQGRGGERRRDKKKMEREAKECRGEEAGVEGQGESEGQKDGSCDRSEGEGGGGGGGCYFNTSAVCSSGPAGKRGNGTLKHFTCMN